MKRCEAFLLKTCSDSLRKSINPRINDEGDGDGYDDSNESVKRNEPNK